MEDSSLVKNTSTGIRKFLVWYALGYSLILANFVFWSGFNLGFFLAVLIGQIVIFAVFPKPDSTKVFIFSILLSVSILLLGYTYFRYSDIVLGIINFFAIILLLIIQILVYSKASSDDWDSAEFIKSAFISPFVRPFSSLSKLPQSFKESGFSKKPDENSSAAKKVFRQILTGVLISIPLLILIIALLRAADMVFQNYTNTIIDFFAKIRIGEIIFTIVFGSILFPFLFSFLYSHQTRWDDLPIRRHLTFIRKEKFSLNAVVMSTILFLLNTVYGIFTWIQFSALFGAFASVLPEEITYAEYAREGFFQLLFVSLLNISLAVICVLFLTKKGGGRLFSKIMSFLLIIFTFVLLSSAAYRMKMYIEVYSLTKLRVLSSIFMIFIALILFFTFIKEIFPGFKFFKSVFFCALIVLIATNFLNINFMIAQYNTNQYISDSPMLQNSGDIFRGGEKNRYIDSDYLIYDLSYDAVFPTIELLNSTDDPDLKNYILENLEYIYEYHLKGYRDKDFKKWNISKERAKYLIGKTLFENN